MVSDLYCLVGYPFSVVQNFLSYLICIVWQVILSSNQSFQVSLRQIDMNLLCQLWSLNETIQVIFRRILSLEFQATSRCSLRAFQEFSRSPNCRSSRPSKADTVHCHRMGGLILRRSRSWTARGAMRRSSTTSNTGTQWTGEILNLKTHTILSLCMPWKCNCHNHIHFIPGLRIMRMITIASPTEAKKKPFTLPTGENSINQQSNQQEGQFTGMVMVTLHPD